MIPQGYVEYKRREFCKDVACPIQMQLDTQKEGCPAYEETRKKCSNGCLYTTWQFHHWLIEKGYIIIASSQLKNNQATILVNIDKDLLNWIHEQVKAGKHQSRDQLIEKALRSKKEKAQTSSTTIP